MIVAGQFPIPARGQADGERGHAGVDDPVRTADHDHRWVLRRPVPPRSSRYAREASVPRLHPQLWGAVSTAYYLLPTSRAAVVGWRLKTPHHYHGSCKT